VLFENRIEKKMCKRGDTIEMRLPVVGEIRYGVAEIDKCIAPIIKALNDGGVITRGCCCGHGEVMGYIHLDSGKYLGVFPNRKTLMKYRHEKFSKLKFKRPGMCQNRRQNNKVRCRNRKDLKRITLVSGWGLPKKQRTYYRRYYCPRCREEIE
jgi:hypothetical protein